MRDLELTKDDFATESDPTGVDGFDVVMDVIGDCYHLDDVHRVCIEVGDFLERKHAAQKAIQKAFLEGRQP